MDETKVKKPFWSWVFCESDGSPSFARIGTGLLACFACGWVTALVCWNHTLPALGELAIFITVLYGANKFATVFTKKES